MEDLIDFPCSASWTEYYYERGLTSRRAATPPVVSASAWRRAILRATGESDTPEAAALDAAERTIRAQAAELAALRRRLTLAERALAGRTRTPAPPHAIEEEDAESAT